MVTITPKRHNQSEKGTNRKQQHKPAGKPQEPKQKEISTNKRSLLYNDENSNAKRQYRPSNPSIIVTPRLNRNTSSTTSCSHLQPGNNITLAIRFKPMKRGPNPFGIYEDDDRKRFIYDTNILSDVRDIDRKLGLEGKEPIDGIYAYDAVFDEHDSTQDIYNTVIDPLVSATLSGFNTAILAYGQTSSGKTHTILGKYGKSVSPGSSPSSISSSTPNYDIGLLGRACEKIFNTVHNDVTSNYIITLGFLEVYNENIYDIMKSVESNVHDKGILQVLSDKDGSVHIDNCSITVTSLNQILNYIKRATKIRRTAETKMNTESSRSHAIIRIKVESSKGDRVTVGLMQFVDLAGSENAKNVDYVSEERRNEGSKINRSLFFLSNVIRALSDVERKKQLEHINYRGSVLTRVLKDSLGGNSHTVMLCCVSSEAENRNQTESTLSFAQRAKFVKCKPRINEIRYLESKLGSVQRDIGATERGIDALSRRMTDVPDIDLERQKEDLQLKLFKLQSSGICGRKSLLSAQVRMERDQNLFTQSVCPYGLDNDNNRIWARIVKSLGEANMGTEDNNTKLKKVLNEVQSELNSLKVTHDNTTKELSQFRTDHKANRSEIDSLKYDVNKFKGMAVREGSMDTALAHTMTLTSALNSKLEYSQSKIKLLEEDATICKAKMENYESIINNLSNDIETAQTSILNKEQEVNRLLASLSGCKIALDNEKTSHQEIREQLEPTLAKLNFLKNENLNLSKKLEEKYEENRMLISKSEELKFDMRIHQEVIQDLNNCREQLNTVENALQKAKMSFCQDLEALKKKYNAAQLELATFKTKYQIQQESILHLNGELDEYVDKVAILKSEHTHLLNKYEQHQIDYSSTDDANATETNAELPDLPKLLDEKNKEIVECHRSLQLKEEELIHAAQTLNAYKEALKTSQVRSMEMSDELILVGSLNKSICMEANLYKKKNEVYKEVLENKCYDYTDSLDIDYSMCNQLRNTILDSLNELNNNYKSIIEYMADNYQDIHIENLNSLLNYEIANNENDRKYEADIIMKLSVFAKGLLQEAVGACNNEDDIQKLKDDIISLKTKLEQFKKPRHDPTNGQLAKPANKHLMMLKENLRDVEQQLKVKTNLVSEMTLKYEATQFTVQRLENNLKKVKAENTTLSQSLDSSNHKIIELNDTIRSVRLELKTTNQIIFDKEIQLESLSQKNREDAIPSKDVLVPLNIQEDSYTEEYVKRLNDDKERWKSRAKKAKADLDRYKKFCSTQQPSL